MNDDAFLHLPQLRGRVTPPEQSTLRVTPALMAAWDERARLAGREACWRWTDEQIEASRQTVLGAWHPEQDLWVFSYGSLMWDPGFHFTEVRRADLRGFRRRFSFKTELGRGSPEFPGLMLSLEAGAGHCCGLVFRIAAASVQAESAIVWRREMVRGSYRPTLHPVSTPQGDTLALVFASNPGFADHVGELPLGQAAAMIATASGFLGSNRQYLEQMAEQLVHLEIEDNYVQELLHEVRRLGAPARCPE